MTPTERDKNRYAIIARVSEEVEEAPRNWEEALHMQHICRIGVSKVAHDISVHLDDEDLRAEEVEGFGDSRHYGKIPPACPCAPRCGVPPLESSPLSISASSAFPDGPGVRWLFSMCSI